MSESSATGNATMQIPADSSGITPEWLSSVLSTKIVSDGFHVEGNIQSGSGFLSSMSRVKCQTSDSTQYELVVKLLPQDESMRALVISEELDRTEIEFYTKAATELMRILPELKGSLCHAHYGRIQEENEETGVPYNSVLILEDLKPLQYYTINFAGEETEAQIKEVVEFLGKFHFAGQALEEEKGMSLSDYYDFLQGCEVDESSMFFEMAKAGFPELDRLFKSCSVSEDIVEAYGKLADHSDKIIEMVLKEGRKFAGLVHGDLWSSNLLFNDNPEYPTKVIDWQLLGYKDPTYDLGVTIVSSVPVEKLSRETVQNYVTLYLDVFEKHCKESQKSHLIKRSRQEFEEFFYSWGMAYTTLWCLLSSDAFVTNLPRVIKLYEFLKNEMNVPEFLLKQITSQET